MSIFFYWIVYLFPTVISKIFYIFRILVFCWLKLLEISFSTLACLFIIFSVSFDVPIPLGLSSGRHKQELAIQTKKFVVPSVLYLSCFSAKFLAEVVSPSDHNAHWEASSKFNSPWALATLFPSLYLQIY